MSNVEHCEEREGDVRSDEVGSIPAALAKDGEAVGDGEDGKEGNGCICAVRLERASEGQDVGDASKASSGTEALERWLVLIFGGHVYYNSKQNLRGRCREPQSS